LKILLINKVLYPKGGDAISVLTTGKILSAKGHKVVFWGEFIYPLLIGVY
jgi:hypothetical protein